MKNCFVVIFTIFISFISIWMSLFQTPKLTIENGAITPYAWGYPLYFVIDNQNGASSHNLNLKDDHIDYMRAMFNFFFFYCIYTALIIYLKQKLQLLGKQNFFRPKNVFFLSIIFILLWDIYFITGKGNIFTEYGHGPRPFTIQEQIYILLSVFTKNVITLLFFNALYFLIYKFKLKTN